MRSNEEKSLHGITSTSRVRALRGVCCYVKLFAFLRYRRALVTLVLIAFFPNVGHHSSAWVVSTCRANAPYGSKSGVFITASISFCVSLGRL